MSTPSNSPSNIPSDPKKENNSLINDTFYIILGIVMALGIAWMGIVYASNIINDNNKPSSRNSPFTSDKGGYYMYYPHL